MFTRSFVKAYSIRRPLYRGIGYFLILFPILYLMCCGKLSHAAEFEKFERGHFIVYHNNRSVANKLSWKAEYHYKRIVNHLGVRSFRPWEAKEKCPIYLYRAKTDYLKATGAPEWSVGIAQYNPFRFASYEGAPNLLIDTLPHEMTHMLLYIFMDEKRIPLWLNEGMAQFEEEDQKSNYHRKRLIKWHMREGNYIPLKELINIKNLQNMDEERVSLFYAEAASVVDHLITDNIRANYGRFLTSIKNGDTAEAALKKAYQWKYKNGIGDLEKRWLDFIKRKY